jgi:hypothetical protein
MEKQLQLYLVSFSVRNGESTYILKHTLRATTDSLAEKSALFYARDFWMHAEDAKPITKGKGNYGWYSPDGGEAIMFEGIQRASPEKVARELELELDLPRMKKLMR